MMEKLIGFYQWMLDQGDDRVQNWLLMQSPKPVVLLFIVYILLIKLGPKLMKNYQPMDLKYLIIPYNFALVGLSFYMFYEFLVTSIMARYSLICQPVDYSDHPLAIRMASVCWWFFFSKIIELLDTLFFILRKKNNQITFLHVYHHCTMIINWWLGAKYIAGGQSFFLAMVNSFVHIWMYTYYGLAAIGPQMQKYLWWKRYITVMQLSQFVAVLIHTGINMSVDCPFPQGFNYAVFIYAISLIILFGNFFNKAYVEKGKKSSDNFANGSIGNVKNGACLPNHQRKNKKIL